MVSHGGVPSENRANSIAWLPRPAWQWLYDKLHIAATAADEWGSDTSGATGEVQFARYEVGEHYGWHADSDPNSPGDIARRTLSIVAVVSTADAGGELEVRGAPALDLAAGDAVVFPSRVEHRATTVSAGRRESIVLWLTRPPEPTTQAPPAWQSITELAPHPVDPDSPWFMSSADFQIGINQLVAEGLKLPYGFIPGSRPGGIVTAIQTSWARWKRSYGFNPPDFLKDLPEYASPDPDASPKPRWQTILEAVPRGKMVATRRESKERLRSEGQRRITAAYGARGWHEEIEMRMGGRQPQGSDVERDRLRGRHAALKAWVEQADRTLAELEAFDPSADVHWEAPSDP